MSQGNDTRWDRTEELIRQCKDGDDHDLERLLDELQGFVVFIVKRHLGGVQYGTFEDLVNAGNRGLLEAYRNYDHSRGSKFTTYAWHYVNNAIDVEKWINRGFSEDLAKHVSKILSIKYKLEKAKEIAEEAKRINPDAPDAPDLPDAKLLAQKSHVSLKKVERIMDFLEAQFLQLEGESDDGSYYDWLSQDDILKDNKETVHVEKAWEFLEEEIGFINPRMALFFQKKWSKDTPERLAQFLKNNNSPDRCYKRRLVFAHGARGKLDAKTLKETLRYSNDAGVYARRKTWKDLSAQ